MQRTHIHITFVEEVVSIVLPLSSMISFEGGNMTMVRVKLLKNECGHKMEIFKKCLERLI